MMNLNNANLIRISNGEYFAEILAGYGGALQGYGNQLINCVQGFSDADFGVERPKFFGSLLCPFPNRITDGKYRFANQEYQLNINFKHENNAIHGLVYNQAGRVELHTESSLVLVFENEGFTGYLFKFELRVSYTLASNGGLKIETEVKNTGNEALPFGIGWHPYFKLVNKVDELHLQLPASGRYLMSKQIPTGEVERYRMFTKPELIDETSLDDCFAVKEDETTVTLIDRKAGFKLLVDCGNHAYLQVYTPPTRDMIAIEPQTCIPNAFNNGTGLISLKSGEQANHFYSIAIQSV